MIARRGLTRVYWTLEFTAAEMKEQVADIPVQDTKDAVEIMRNWSNDKALQVAMHTLRGNLSPDEAGTALSNIAEASIAGVLAAAVEDFTQTRSEGGMAAVILDDPAVGEAALGAELDLMFLYDGSGSPDHYRDLCERSLDALRALSRDNLLLSPIPVGRTERTVRSWQTFRNTIMAVAQPANCWSLPARAVFSHPVMPGWENGLRILALKSSPMALPVMRC